MYTSIGFGVEINQFLLNKLLTDGVLKNNIRSTNTPKLIRHDVIRSSALPHFHYFLAKTTDPAQSPHCYRMHHSADGVDVKRQDLEDTV